MNNNDLNNLRNNYNKLMEKKNELLELKDLINKLEDNESVKKYLELVSDYKKLTKSVDLTTKDDTYFIYKAFRSTSVIQAINLFVYMGTYKLNYNKKNSHIVSRFSDDADFVLYRNIESKGSNLKLSLDKAKIFESEHPVIVKDLIFDYNSFFLEVQREYLSVLMTNKEEDAQRHVLSLYNK